jgi:hypothetical protein
VDGITYAATSIDHYIWGEALSYTNATTGTNFETNPTKLAEKNISTAFGYTWEQGFYRDKAYEFSDPFYNQVRFYGGVMQGTGLGLRSYSLMMRKSSTLFNPSVSFTRVSLGKYQMAPLQVSNFFRTGSGLYTFQKLGYGYFTKISKLKGGGKEITHYVYFPGKAAEQVGVSSIKNGVLTNDFSIPTHLQNMGVSKRMYAELHVIGFNSVKGWYPNFSHQGTNYDAFMKVYRKELHNEVEALMSTPAGKALGPGWVPDPNSIQIIEGMEVKVTWIKQ